MVRHDRRAQVASLPNGLQRPALDIQGDEVRVKSRFIMYRNRLQDETDFFVGKRPDVFRRDATTGWKIARRKIILDQSVLLAKNVTLFF
jgi:3-phenylpropionate/cinnamic acid dioxygenase small subunit